MNPIQQALEALKRISSMPQEDNEWDGADKFREARDIARTAYEALSAYQDGWVLVPIKPTPNMVVAAWASALAEDAEGVWNDMVASTRQHMEGE